MTKALVTFFGLIFVAHPAFAKCNFARLVGWSIIYSGQVTGYYEKDGQKKDEFEGCDYGRVLIVDYTRSVTCADYNYSYAFLPDILVLAKGADLKACINDEMYDIAR